MASATMRAISPLIFAAISPMRRPQQLEDGLDMASSKEIKAALDRAADMVGARPAVGQRVYVSTAVVEEGLACRVQEKDHLIITDLPSSMGGENLGPSPSALLRAALSSCVAMGVKMWAARCGVPIDRVEVRVETGVDARGQFGVADEVTPGFESFRTSIDIASPAAADRVAEIVETSLRFSPLIDALRQSQAIETTLNISRRETR
jgi:uncharacterized OsmC-like protein